MTAFLLRAFSSLAKLHISQLTCMQNLEAMLLQLRDRHGKEMAFFLLFLHAIEAASYLHHQSENAKEKQLLG